VRLLLGRYSEAAMKYVLAILLPPLGLLSVGKVFQAIICLILWVTVLGWPIAAIWAVLVVNSAENEERLRRYQELRSRER
jgi:uncharacterized membrane protein YqaE (UPF0057 family)